MTNNEIIRELFNRERLKKFRVVELLKVTVDEEGELDFSTVCVGENRLHRQFGLESFAVVSFSRDRDCLEGDIQNRRILRNGFEHEGKKWQFCCFSASMLREGKALFTCIDPDEVRAWIGDFSSIKNVSKLGARIGQPLSQSIPTITIPVSQVKVLSDIKRNGYEFTDGCGRISLQLAKQIRDDIGLSYMPSAFQFRYAGAKGIVVVDKKVRGLELRESQVKFQSSHTCLEILGWSKRSVGRLNSQFISILSGREINPDVFKAIADEAISKLLRITDSAEDAKIALGLIGQADEVADKDYSTITRMLNAGFEPYKEPYLKRKLLEMRKQTIINMRQGKIPVEKAATAYAVADFTGTLKPGQVYFNGMTGAAVIGRCPALHPGDMQRVTMVDAPELNHMKNVVVVPVTGKRPLLDMLGGGDLDGDMCMLFWDSRLIPDADYEPAAWEGAEASKQDTVTVNDLKRLVLDSLGGFMIGSITMWHQAWADQKDITCEQCLKLAEIQNKAIDAAKTGAKPEIPETLKTNKYPHWLEVDASEDTEVYHSESAMGKLYDHVLERGSKLECRAYPELDLDLYQPGSQFFVSEAKAKYKSYNSEIANVLKSTEDNSDERETAIEAVVERYRSDFLSEDPSKRFAKAFANYWTAYSGKYWSRKSIERESYPLSFPWITCGDYLIAIKAQSGSNTRLVPVKTREPLDGEVTVYRYSVRVDGEEVGKTLAPNGTYESVIIEGRMFVRIPWTRKMKVDSMCEFGEPMKTSTLVGFRYNDACADDIQKGQQLTVAERRVEYKGRRVASIAKNSPVFQGTHTISRIIKRTAASVTVELA